MIKYHSPEKTLNETIQQVLWFKFDINSYLLSPSFHLLENKCAHL